MWFRPSASTNLRCLTPSCRAIQASMPPYLSTAALPFSFQNESFLASAGFFSSVVIASNCSHIDFIGGFTLHRVTHSPWLTIPSWLACVHLRSRSSHWTFSHPALDDHFFLIRPHTLLRKSPPSQMSTHSPLRCFHNVEQPPSTGNVPLNANQNCAVSRKWKSPSGKNSITCSTNSPSPNLIPYLISSRWISLSTWALIPSPTFASLFLQEPCRPAATPAESCLQERESWGLVLTTNWAIPRCCSQSVIHSWKGPHPQNKQITWPHATWPLAYLNPNQN